MTTRPNGSKRIVHMDGVGDVWEVTLCTYSEDGRQDEFRGVFLTEDEAEQVRAFWCTGGMRMVRMCSSLQSMAGPMCDEDEGDSER